VPRVRRNTPRPPARSAPDRRFVRGEAARATATDPSAARAASPQDVGYEAINGAYRVIDEYLRQGQKVAGELWLPGTDGRPGIADVPRVVERFMQSAGDLGAAWLDLFAAGVTPASGKPDATGTAGPFRVGRRADSPTSGSPAAAPVASAVPLVVSTARPVDVSVDASGPVESWSLGAVAGARGSAATGVSARLAPGPDGRAVLTVKVAATAKRGTFTATITRPDAEGPAGVVTIRVR